MIDKIYAAPKYVNEKKGIDFAVKYQLSYEIPGFMGPSILEQGKELLTNYRKRISGIQGNLSLHGPVFDTNPVSLDPRIAKSSRLRYNQAINICKALGTKYIVFHSQYSPIYDVANVYNEWMAQVVDYWQEVVETQLQDSSLIILMENFMDNRPEILLEMASRINSPHFKICLDVGHVNLFSKLHPIKWLDVLGSHLAYIHAHNNHGEKDEHCAFNHGSIDMEGFLNHLVLLPNKINLALEVFSMEGIEESYQILLPFLEMQETHMTTKSFIL